MTKVQALGSREDETLTITVLWQEVAVGEKFVHLGSLIHLTIQSSPDSSRRNAITRAAMQNLDNQMWKSRISISTKLKLYITCILPIFLCGSEYSFPFGELDETTGTSSYYMDEDYPAGPEIQ